MRESLNKHGIARGLPTEDPKRRTVFVTQRKLENVLFAAGSRAATKTKEHVRELHARIWCMERELMLTKTLLAFLPATKPA